MERWTKDNIFNIVSNSSCVSDVCKQLGITSTASNYKTFYKYAKKYEIKYSHFNSKNTDGLKKYITNKKIKDIDVFVEDSTYAQAPLRKRIKKFNILPYKCFECGIGDVWNHKKISLQLDHINGKNTDHRLYNLRWLCPNCHSQTLTYVGRNKHK